ncbi:MAG: hypothetical protein ABR588_02670 [Sphingomicrobium sp.]|nr:hypothetical protein [Sphingomonadales bacterium]
MSKVLRRAQLQRWAREYAFAPGAQPPEGWPDAHRLCPAGLYPLQCGENARGVLTAIYAVANAGRLLLFESQPLRPSEEWTLLEAGWRFVRDHRAAAGPWSGVQTTMVERLAEAMTILLLRCRASTIRCERVSIGNVRGGSFDLTLERLLVGRCVVVVLLGRGHYTVVHGYTGKSWLLFDATGRSWTKRRLEASFGRPDWRTAQPFALALSRSI